MNEQGETVVTSGGKAPLTNAPSDGERVPVRVGSQLFLVKPGTGDDKYRCLPDYFQGKRKKIKNRDMYKGFYNCDTPAAIVKTELLPTDTDPAKQQKEGEEKRKIKNAKKESEREFRILKELDAHENFIQYFAREMDEKQEFVYLATELCLCSVEDLLDSALKEEVCFRKPNSTKKQILMELPAKEILRQATRGLNYLHQNNFVHRNIKPNNFLIQEVNKKGDGSCRFVVKITDFRLARKRDPSKTENLSGTAASQGWEAPESRDEKKELSSKLDVFILGCFYHYVLIALSENEANKGKPRHPFGDRELLRQDLITQEDYSVYKGQLPFVPSDTEEEMVVVLMKKMLQFKETGRPTLEEILEDSYFKPCADYKIYDNEDKTKKPGFCVIFNQQKFKNSKDRKGSDQDRNALENTFKRLGFTTKVHENLSSFDVKNKIENLSDRDWDDYGCLVVCFLSHGIENAILCYDGFYVNTNELKYKFSLGNCPSLYGKPKIFIIQACQGGLGQNKTGIFDPYEKQRRRRSLPNLIDQQESSRSTVQLTKKDMKQTYEIDELEKLKIWDYAQKNPPLMDFLTINATLPGFVSYRNRFQGTFFVQALCKTLDEVYSGKKLVDGTNNMDLENVLRLVQLNINSKCVNGKWQTMPWEACLSKYIRFRRCET
ncbi:caspase 8 [Daphnia sinensis]|uniref:Caspase 8 n=1 Tax=Daphnia sinensis TaxID=1820382 RepID=A0AAD5LVM7_9CRUS|nr:caspase 8 [Daphnia sinensis]